MQSFAPLFTRVSSPSPRRRCLMPRHIATTGLTWSSFETVISRISHPREIQLGQPVVESRTHVAPPQVTDDEKATQVRSNVSGGELREEGVELSSLTRMETQGADASLEFCKEKQG